MWACWSMKRDTSSEDVNLCCVMSRFALFCPYTWQELERTVDQQSQVQEKLHSSESEIRTLKSFLTSKTAMMERRKRELEHTRVQLAELEEKDKRRAVILADVLEKTARQHQHRLKSPRKYSYSPSQSGMTLLPNRWEMNHIHYTDITFLNRASWLVIIALIH